MTEHRRLNCSPEEVFDVLNDGWSYPLWVVGASRIRDVDAGWPAPRSKLHHSFGVWPLLIDDSTEVLEIEPGKRLVLEARGWPIGKARVEITVEADGLGSSVSISEDASGGPARLACIYESPSSFSVPAAKSARRARCDRSGRASQSPSSNRLSRR